MRHVGNFLWFVLGGWLSGLLWVILGVLAFITIVGIPWARSCFVIGVFAFFPFGKEAVNREDLTQTKDIGTGVGGVIGNIIWFVLAGFWLALSHIALALVCFFSIIGIPFALQHLKLAGLCLFPIGKVIVSKQEASIMRKTNAQNSLISRRNSS